MKRYAKLLVLTVLLLLMVPFVAAAGNDSDSSIGKPQDLLRALKSFRTSVFISLPIFFHSK